MAYNGWIHRIVTVTNIMYDKLHKHSFKNPIKARRYIDRYIKFIDARKRGSLVFSCGGYQWMMYDDYNNGE